MITSEQLNELAAALSKAQAAMRPAIKNAVNPHFKSRYADLGAIWDAAREPLANNGLSVVQLPCDAEAGRVGLITTLLHSSGQYISSMVSTRLVKDDAQGIGSALSYLRRYALSAMLGIVADDDDDGEAASNGKHAGEVERLRDELYSLAEQVTDGGHQLTDKETKLLGEIATLDVNRLRGGIAYFRKLLNELPTKAA